VKVKPSLTASSLQSFERMDCLKEKQVETSEHQNSTSLTSKSDACQRRQARKRADLVQVRDIVLPQSENLQRSRQEAVALAQVGNSVRVQVELLKESPRRLISVLGQAELPHADTN
jgi:hypothetical protein